MDTNITDDASYFDAARLLKQAERETGLSDWGDRDFVDRFSEFVDCIVSEGAVRTTSRAAATERLLQVLKGRLTLLADRKRFPGIAQEQIVRPIIACGLARAGTTFLHAVMAQDPANRSPKTWEITCPSPPPESATYHTDPRIDAVQASLERQGFLAPELQAAHPFGAKPPDECGFIMDYLDLRYCAVFFNVPSYATRRSPVDPLHAYEFHRQFLQHLQFRCKGERWVLKAPGHITQLQEILAVYPDATILQNHRDPAKVIPSITSLLMMLAGLFTDSRPDAKERARAQIEYCSNAMRTAMEFRSVPANDEHFFDVHFVDLISDPIATVQRIYDHCGLELSQHAVTRMEDFVARDKTHGGGGMHKYSLGDFGLDTDQIEQHFAEYIDHYGIAREVPR